jgi:hypothetical protein
MGGGEGAYVGFRPTGWGYCSYLLLSSHGPFPTLASIFLKMTELSEATLDSVLSTVEALKAVRSLYFACEVAVFKATPSIAETG